MSEGGPASTGHADRTPDTTRAEAMRLHQAGCLPQAASLYRTLLEDEPHAFDVLVLLSLLEHRRGDAVAALDFATRAVEVRRSPEALLQQAVALRACGRDDDALSAYDEVLSARPDLPVALFNRGNLLRDLGRHAEALASYERLLAIDPEDVAALNNRAVALLELDRPNEALCSCETALRLRPDHVQGLTNRGNVLRRLGRLREAAESYAAALRLAPGDARVLSNRARVHHELERFEDALGDAEGALAIDPRSAAALVSRALALVELGRGDEALTSSEQALAIDPVGAEALNARGTVLQQLGRHEDAVASHRKALARDASATSAVNVGNALLALDRPEEALASYEEALARQPDHAGAWSNRGNALQILQRHEEALASYRRASELAPDDADAHWNEGLCRLALGEYERGWALYEWRLARRAAHSSAVLACPHLTGDEDVAGKSVLVHTEQGHGDALQFIRYVPLLAARGARVVLASHRSLHRLFASVEGVAEVLGPHVPIPALDHQVALPSLPHVLRATQRTVPADVPYLRCSAAAAERWRAKVSRFGRAPRVGLVWAGNPDFPGAHRKAIRLAELRRLLDRDATFFSLQKGRAAAEIAALGLAGRIIDLTADLENFDDTAALVSALDLVISVDTAVAHLAGALGKPVWILLQRAADWRWLVGRADSPWYPTARLFRQAGAGEWSDVVRRVNHALVRFQLEQQPPRH